MTAPDPAPADSDTTSAWSLDKQIARARREMGAARWAELNELWEQPE